MMPAIGRLKTRPEFLKVAAAGAKWVTPGLVLQARRRPATPAAGTARDVGAEQVRVGFTVSRKVGNAIRRNRARRRLRAVVADVLPEHGRAGCDYVLIGRAAILHHDFPELSRVPDFQPIALPASRAHLADEGLSPAFIDYMGNWKGFVEAA